MIRRTWAFVAARQLDHLAAHLVRPAALVAPFGAHDARVAHAIVLAIAAYRLLGFDLPPGFKLPFLSRSFAEFFRRYNHFVRDAVVSVFYFPILGNLRRRLPGRIDHCRVPRHLHRLAHAPGPPDPERAQPASARHDPRSAAAVAHPGMLVMWSLIVLPNAGIVPRRREPTSRLRAVFDVVLMDTAYAVLWYVETR